MCCSLPGSSVHGTLQARILEWVAMPSSRGSSYPRDLTCVSCLLHQQAGSLPIVPWKSHIYVCIYMGLPYIYTHICFVFLTEMHICVCVCVCVCIYAFQLKKQKLYIIINFLGFCFKINLNCCSRKVFGLSSEKFLLCI